MDIDLDDVRKAAGPWGTLIAMVMVFAAKIGWRKQKDGQSLKDMVSEIKTDIKDLKSGQQERAVEAGKQGERIEFIKEGLDELKILLAGKADK